MSRTVGDDVLYRIAPTDQLIYDTSGNLVGIRNGLRAGTGADFRVETFTEAATATPTSSSTVLGETGGVVKRFAVDDLSPRVMVSWYSPHADGETADNTAIQAAITAATSAGAIAFLEDGDYAVDAINSPVTLAAGASLEMAPGARILTLGNSSASVYGTLTVTGSNVTIRGGTIVGDREGHDYSSGGTHEQGACVLIYPTSADISNILIEGVRTVDSAGDGVLMFGVNNSGTYAGPKDVTIRGCTFEDHRRQGISVVLGNNTSILNNVFKNIGSTKYGTDGTNPKAGIDVEGGSSPRRTLIDGNYFENCPGGAIILYNANGARVVNNHCVDYGILFQYSANVVIANNIVRCAAGAGGGIRQTTGAAIVSVSGKQLAVGLKYIIVARSTFDFTTVGAADNTPGTIFICTAVGVIGSGDQVQQVLENVLIADNIVYGGGNGIDSSGHTYRVVISGNHLYDQATNGIFVGNLAGNSGSYGGEVVTGNKLFNQAIGIKSSGLPVVIADNVIDTTSGRAIYAPSSSTGGVIRNNDIKAHGNATNAAFDLGGAGWDVVGNHFRMNHATTGNYAIFLSATGSKAINNTITGACGTAAIRVSQAAKIVGNRLLAVDSPDCIYCSTTNGSASIVVGNYVESVKASGNRYGIRFAGGGTGVRIIQNNVNNSASTFTQAIDTSANTTSVVAENIVSGGAVNTHASDTVSGNVTI